MSLACPDLSVIILSYNVRDLLRNCLHTVFASRGQMQIEVFVVDNCSHDASTTMVREEFAAYISDPVVTNGISYTLDVIDAPRNGGFSYGNNIGLRRSKGRYVLLLNPDTELPPDALQSMVDYLDTHPQAGVAGPKLVLRDGRLDLACRRSFPTPQVSLYRMLMLSKLFPRSPRFAGYNMTYLDPDTPTEVDSVVGAFMMVRREAMEQAGYMDESFFMYGEDLDWALRIKQCGYQVHYWPRVTVLHLKGQSSRQLSVRSIVEFYRAMLIFYRKHYAHNTFFLLNWFIIAGIYTHGGLALLVNSFRPRAQKRTTI